MYTNTTNIVKVNELLTDDFSSAQGVKQGDNLSPTGFNIFINELLRKLECRKEGVRIRNEVINCLAYADDIVLICESEQDLQTLLNVVNDWCKKWSVTVNTSKTKIIHFRKRGHERTSYPLELNNTALEVVTKYKYLGTWMTEHFDCTKNVNMLSAAGSRALWSVIGKTKDNYDLSFGSFTKLIEACVLPIIDYGSEVWCQGTDCRKIDQV